MAKMIPLRWTKVKDPSNTQGFYFDSNLIILNDDADVEIQCPDQRGMDITYLVSLSGTKFVTIFQDYFAELHIHPIPIRGHGQTVKFRINRIPEYAVVLGQDIEDGGDINPEDPSDTNGFAGMEGEYFRDINTEIFSGKPY